MVTTHSPFFVDGLRPRSPGALPGMKGLHSGKKASDMKGIPEFVEDGANLGGSGWRAIQVGDPLTASGGPKDRQKAITSEKSMR